MDSIVINYEREFEKLESMLVNLRILKPLLYKKIYHTGSLFQYLANELEKNELNSDNFVLDNDYILAGYYANIGFLAIEDSIYKDNYTNENDLQIIKRHVKISADLLHEKGLKNIGDIVKLHHEKPNGSGFLREQNTNKKIAILNIADEFLDSILPYKRPESPMVYEEAIEFCLNGYQSMLILNHQEIRTIKQSLFEYFSKNSHV
jgi:response regulator RpfG family c-di-GMP phosphodiesterase